VLLHSRRRSPARVVTISLATVGGLAILAVGAGAAVLGAWWARSEINTVGTISFDNELAIPPLADSRVDAQGRRVFDLTLQRGTTEFFPAVPTQTWGVNGSYLGPTVRAARGEQVVLNVRNALDEQTTVHWHGMHLPARMDGGPHQPINTGSTWSPTWRIGQPAATLWYHPHPHGETAKHVYRGIAGMFIVDDAVSSRDLPSRYGVDDVPVIVQDRRFDDAGQLDEAAAPGRSTGLLGDTILVNGTVAPHLDVTSQRVRLRLLNASNARIYDFGLSDGRTLTVIGSDGGLLAKPYDTQRIMLSPGERAEVVVTVRAGERTVLRSYPPALGADFWNERFAGGDDSFDVLELRAADSLTPSPAVPARLADLPRLEATSAVTTRHFDLGGTHINGRDMDMDRIDETVTVGETEIWRLSNRGGTPHNFHVHDVQFQVLDVDGERPPAHLGGWKDTVFVPPDTSVTLVMRFSDYTDPDVPYMFHCHLLAHEDRGMMGQFVVVQPGQSAGAPAHHH
jgi:blue copper oxidase